MNQQKWIFQEKLIKADKILMKVIEVLPILDKCNSMEEFFTKCSTLWFQSKPEKQKDVLNKINSFNISKKYKTNIKISVSKPIKQYTPTNQCYCAVDFKEKDRLWRCPDCKKFTHYNCQLQLFINYDNYKCPYCRHEIDDIVNYPLITSK